EAALAEVRAIPHDGTEAEALMLLASVRDGSSGDYEGSAEFYRAAMRKAEQAGNDALVARAAARLSFILGDKLFRFYEAGTWWLFADAARQRLGANDQLEGDVLQSRGILFEAEGHPERGKEPLERALALRRAVFGPDHPESLKAMSNLGYLNQLLGRHDEAF